MNLLSAYIAKLEEVADRVITDYYKDLLNSEDPFRRFSGEIGQFTNRSRAQDTLHSTTNFDDLFDSIRLDDYISESLKHHLIDAFKEALKSSLYIPPSDNELLNFLQEGDEK